MDSALPFLSFPTLFENQARHQPDTIALTFAQEQITFQELNSRANRLAHFLQARGVGADVRVAMCLERSPEMIIVLLAILKAGGAYIPLDPSYPQERLHFMLQDADVSLLLTQHTLVERIMAPSDICVVVVERDSILWSGESTQNPERMSIDANNLAYLIYTSGSSGRPKGTLLTHQNLSSNIEAFAQHLQLVSSDRVLQLASLSFDASVLEITQALAMGATLCMQKQEDLVPGPLFIDLLDLQGISFAVFVPSFSQRLPPAKLPALRVVVSGGETFTPDLIEQWAVGRQFCNSYGPTETTIGVTLYWCHPGDTIIPLGDPLLHSHLYVLNKHMQPVEPGESGEVYIGGLCVARGYHKQFTITAERFVPDPFSQQPGQRLYRTGDLALVLPDRQIVFRGRSDTQVKLRGFRIELSEIERVLSACDALKDVVVLCREDVPGDQRLVAYIVAQEEYTEKQARDIIEQYAKTHLPSYMLPTQFILLAAFPLTPNTKIDRQALPAPNTLRPELTTPWVEPSSAVEQSLAHICSTILRIDRLGVDDNFFELGGNSLMIAQVAARIENVFGVRIPPATFFTHPSVAGLAAYIEQAGGKESTTFTPSKIPVLPREGQLFPLSFSQERVWFLQELEPDNRAYHAQALFHIKGALNTDALKNSLQAIFQRHEIFRTTFPLVDGMPRQQIHVTYHVQLPYIDLGALSLSEREHEIQQILLRELQTPFDLTRLPLARWLLMRLEDQQYLLLHLEHHLVHDGWSFANFLQELQHYYNACILGTQPQLLPLSIQFVDFASWQRHWMQGEEAMRQLAYWRKMLADAPAVLELPTDYPRPRAQTFRGSSLRVVLPYALQQSIRELCRREGTTLYMTLFAAFVTLLMRYTNQTDICVGCGVANRRWAEAEALIGMIINTIVLRVRMDDHLTFRELLEHVRQVTLEGYANQDLPFGKVVEELQPQRSLSHLPFYQVAFSFHDSHAQDLRLQGLSVEIEEAISNGSAKCDLNIVVIPRAEQRQHSTAQDEQDELIFVWEYNTDLFEQATIQRMIDAYHTLLEAVCLDSTQRLSALPLLSPAADRQQLIEWNATQTSYPANQCVHHLFEAQARQTPDAPALTYNELTLTYEKLNSAANQLAHRLIALGVGPETCVGLFMQRSLDLVISVLAILKAGGAYVPLDHTYPGERLSFMLADTQIRVLITQQELCAYLPEMSTDVDILCLEEEWASIRQEPATNPALPVTAENLAYVMYTSGSTGLSKGVLAIHRNAVRLVKNTNYIDLNAQEVFLLFAPLTFDASTFEIWAPLLNGARLVIVPPGVPSLGELARILLTESVTTLLLTAGLFHRMVDTQLESLRGIHQLLAGGDVLSVSHVVSVLQEDVDRCLINGYGPTEGTTVSCCYPMRTPKAVGSSVSIGRPVANAQVYILDRWMQPVPVGVPGELYIGGDGLARAYLNQPGLTAEAFVPHPFSQEAGARLYRSGDVVRYLADGTIEFFGRRDSQVKIRGFRIEPGEIEAVLLKHPAVRECLVVPFQPVHIAEKFLICYYAPHARQEAPTEQQLRSYAAEHLPSYMIPGAFIQLERFPLTPNGKVDYAALPEPNFEQKAAVIESDGPRNETERIIQGIWSELLHLEQPGIEEHFFALGGHSLLAAQLRARLVEIFDIELTLREIFEHATIADLALLLVQKQVAVFDSEMLAQLLAEIDPAQNEGV